MKKYTKITYTSRFVPDNVVTNHQLSSFMDTSDEWIRTRTGIESRHIATKESTADLCTKVAQQLLAKSGKTPDAIDFIIVATITPDYGMPSVACQVQGALQAVNAFAFDISAACSGFVYALSMADKFIQSGKYQTGLVIGGETLSKVIDWQDRSTAVLFGDGAAGVMVEAADTCHFIDEKLQSDGQRGTSLTSGYVNNQSPFYEAINQQPSFLQMNGRAIFDFAINDVAKNIACIVDDASVDYLLLHQANVRIIDKIAKKTKIAREKFLTNMDQYGNTSAASIPILLDEAVEQKTLVIGSNQRVVLTGFGGGLTWGSILLTL
jgi:3-oxoacyl-[acyl-carrier-protein] synthase-3